MYHVIRLISLGFTVHIVEFIIAEFLRMKLKWVTNSRSACDVIAVMLVINCINIIDRLYSVMYDTNIDIEPYVQSKALRIQSSLSFSFRHIFRSIITENQFHTVPVSVLDPCVKVINAW